jgi:predicted nucleic acid-binding protein
MSSTLKVILDTNIFVAAGFNRRSSSYIIISMVEDGKVKMVWNQRTLAETRRIINQIPVLHWSRFADIFRAESEFTGETHPENFGFIADPEDRKFAALAAATGATLITNDTHFLDVRDEFGGTILQPREWLANFQQQ